MRYDFERRGLDSAFEYAKAAKFTGIAKQAGAWYEMPGGKKLQGEGKLRAAIEQDQALRDSIRDRLFSAQ